ncbi:MAG: lipase family protein [Rickettsiales bacterium]|jgi:predicted lipase|nr:lipase family protein [Rickettsiales bacterium]
MPITVDHIKSNMLGVALSRTIEGKKEKDKRKDYTLCRKELEEQLQREEDELINVTPFYKNGDENNIAGYVIETNNKTMVCYHGTRFREALSGHGKQEVKNDLNSRLTNMKFGDEKHLIHEGFKKEYESSKDSLYKILNSRDNKNKPVDFTGHSLGGAVAGIATLDAATNHSEVKIGNIVNFGCPRFFSPKAAKLYKAIGLSDKTLRIKQTLDPVPRVPPKSIFQHVGNSIKLDAPSLSLIHGSGIYKKIADNLTDQDLAKQKPSKDYNSFVVYKYIVNKLDKNTFLKAMDKAFTIRKNLNEMRKKFYGYNTPNNKSRTKFSSLTR